MGCGANRKIQGGSNGAALFLWLMEIILITARTVWPGVSRRIWQSATALALCSALNMGVALAQSDDERLRNGWAAYEVGDAALALRLLDPLAASGNKYAQYAVAELLLPGKQVPRDLPRAIDLFHKAAEQEIPAAQARIGAAFFHGDVIKQDYAQALAWFERGARNGHAAAQTNLAVMYADGIGVRRDPSSAMYWLEQALPRGEPNTLNTLANAYARGEGAARDPARAIALYQQAADAGLAIAMDNLGNYYREGVGVPKDLTAARGWYERAAAVGEPRGLNNLGVLYWKGLGVETDFKRAGDYFRMAAQKNHGDAEANLGLMFLFGQGAALDRDIGTRWMALAAAHGNELAKAYMIVLANTKWAIAEDRKQLQSYSNVLGATGSAATQKLIGDLLSNGILIPVNLPEARRWYLLAARQGDLASAARAQALQ